MENQTIAKNDNVRSLPRRRHHQKLDRGDIVFYFFDFLIMILLLIIVIYPLYFVVIASISDPDAILRGEVIFYPKGITFSGYNALWGETLIWSGYRNTLIYTFLGTAFNIFLTIPMGWALSRHYLPFRKFFMGFFIVTMFVSGGLIPYYLICSYLGLVNNPLILIIGGGLSVYNVFICKSYYENTIPQEVLEAAEVDGCGEIGQFFRIALPLSKSLISVMILFYAVGHWNSYMDALIFISDENYFPLQLVLKNILISAESQSQAGGDSSTIIEQLRIANQIKYASIIVSSLPILIFYPFVQKYFNEGFLVGSFK